MEKGIIWFIFYLAGIIALGSLITRSQETKHKDNKNG
jgi:surface polysaccharide O-acyltransferase-like enzyme